MKIKYIFYYNGKYLYHDRILSNTKKSYNFSYYSEKKVFLKQPVNFHSFELEHLPEHLIGELFGARTMT